MSREIRTLVGEMKTADVRALTLADRPHLVVPVVALLGDSVVRGVNSKVPEFVPAKTLATFPESWDGRPVLPAHPDETANVPAAFEGMWIGQMFNTTYSNGKLKTEAWIDIDKATQLGGDAERVVERIRDGEPIEVSVGAYVKLSETPGEFEGKKYGAVWQSLVSDHLAMLPENATGACSIADGCGAPRLNAKQEQESTMKQDNEPSRLRHMLDSVVRMFANGSSDNDLRSSLWAALRLTVPGLDTIMAVFPDEGRVIYATWLDDQLFFEQGYSLDSDGVAAMKGKPKEVIQSIEFKAAELFEDASKEIASAETGGGVAVDDETSTHKPPQADCACSEKETIMSANTKAELVERLLASESSPFDADDAEHLAAFDEKRLEAMIAKCESLQELIEPTEQVVAPVTEPVEESDEPIEAKADEDEDLEGAPVPVDEITEEQWLASAPKSLSDIVTGYRADEKAKRDALVTALAEGQTAYTREQLEAKDTDDLSSLSVALKIGKPVPDYSGRGLAANSEPKNDAPLPYGDLN